MLLVPYRDTETICGDQALEEGESIGMEFTCRVMEGMRVRWGCILNLNVLYGTLNGNNSIFYILSQHKNIDNNNLILQWINVYIC